MHIAVEGCCHGELDSIYASIVQLEERHGVRVDLLLICGDFQAVRNPSDLATMACPVKYRQMADFYKYYTGEKVAHVLTIVIGGNHEASNHLWELYYGGWLAPKIYFLGYAGVVQVGGIRIGGLTGIYNKRHYHLGHYEAPPYSDDDMRSAYHIRELEVLRLLQLQKPLDIMLSHDWPQHVARHGNLQALLRRKSFLQNEIEDGSLGSPPAASLLHRLKPKYWFSAHLHVKYAAVVRHDEHSVTRFLSLDKCLPSRNFLQLLQLEGDGSEPTLHYDAEWIAVLRATSHLFSVRRGRVDFDPATLSRMSGREDFPACEEAENEVRNLTNGNLRVPENFCAHVEPHRDGAPVAAPQAQFRENPQTTHFVQKFGLPLQFRKQVDSHAPSSASPAAWSLETAPASVSRHALGPNRNPQLVVDEEIDLGDD